MGFLEKFFVGAAVAVAVAGVSGAASARDVVSFDPGYSAGTIVVKTGERKLYYVLGGGQAVRYTVAVGRPGKEWAGQTVIGRMEVNPIWGPPAARTTR